jgi:hypothetical protein
MRRRKGNREPGERRQPSRSVPIRRRPPDLLDILVFAAVVAVLLAFLILVGWFLIHLPARMDRIGRDL